mgnify:CR=1 FL=1
MKKLLLFFVIVSLCYQCKEKPKEKEELLVLAQGEINWKPAQDYYLKHITNAFELLDELDSLPMTGQPTQEAFTEIRTAFKKAETYASYLNPEIGHRANGPALPIVTDDTQRTLLPLGLQKLEESIYEGEETEVRYREEINMMRGLLRNLQDNVRKRELTPQRFFIATHQQLMRIVSLGISGFDTPVSQLGLKETIVSLESLRDVYRMTLQEEINQKNSGLDETLLKNIEAAVDFIRSNMDFESFDRYSFIKDYMNPITRKEQTYQF